MSKHLPTEVYVRDQACSLIPFSYLHQRIKHMRNDRVPPRPLQGVGTALLNPLYKRLPFLFVSTETPTPSKPRFTLTFTPVQINGKWFLEVSGHQEYVELFLRYMETV